MADPVAMSSPDLERAFLRSPQQEIYGSHEAGGETAECRTNRRIM
jgi:hypothetical protein